MAIRSLRPPYGLRLDPLTLFQTSFILFMFTLFMVVPLLAVTYKAFFVEVRPSLYWFTAILSDRFYFPVSIGFTSQFPFVSASWDVGGNFFELSGDALIITGWDLGVILNSVFVAFFTSAISTALGAALGFIFARYSFPLKDALRILILVPLVSMPFVGAIGLLKMIGPAGVLNQLVYETLKLLPFRVILDGLVAVVLVQSLHFYAIPYLTSYTAFVNIDPALEEQAENMGAKGFRLFRTVSFPLALPGIEAGAILVFILSIEDLGAPIVFHHSLARKTLVYQIFSQIFSPTGEVNPLAPALSVILLTIALIGFISIRKYVSLRHYAVISRGGGWAPRVRRLGPLGRALVYLFILAVLAVALLPQVSVVFLSMAEAWGTSLLPEKLGLANYSAVLSKPPIIAAIFNSFLYSMTATAIIVVLGTSAAYLVARKQARGVSLLDFLATLPIAIPGIVLALGYFSSFLGTPLDPVINPAPLIVLAYAIRRSPFTTRSSFAGLQQVHVNLEEASLNLGATTFRTFTKVTIPLILMNVVAGGMLSFVYSVSEVSTSIVLGGINPSYAPVTWKMMDVLYQVAGGPFHAAVLGVLLMAIQVSSMAFSARILKQRATAVIGM